MAIAVPVALLALSVTAEAQGAQAGHQTASGHAAKLSTKVTDKVIIVFKNQLTNVPDTVRNVSIRRADVTADQRAVVSQLAKTHARNVKSFSLINAVSATVSPAEAHSLRANPAVREVIADLPIPVASGPSVARKAAKGITPLPGACRSKGKVQLDPEAIENIHAATQSGKGDAAQALGYTGAGVKVGFIADGLDINNPDFIRANGKHVFVDYQDFSGTGTNAPTDGGEAFLDSSSIAAQGRHVYNVAGYGAGLNTKCNIRILGVAPGASLVGLNVFGSSNFAYNSVFLEAVNYAVNVDHVKVLNESFGSNPFPDEGSLDLTVQADNAAVAAGVTVVASSGDAGVTNTIGSPATDPDVISAGASTTYRAYAQTGIGGITTPGVKGWIDNNISGLSSAGFDQSGGTVDVVAPGDLNWALCTPKPALYAACTNFAGKPASVELSGGTSEAAPLTSGVAALVIQAYAQAHHGQDPTPAVVKQIIVSTAQNIDAPAEQQGAGMIDAYQAVLAARSYSGSTKGAAGNSILKSATQLNAAGQPGASEQLSETLTNDGSASQTIGLSSRTLSPYTPVLSEPLTLQAADGYATEVTFTVPAGQARLNASLALAGVANLSLIAPNGDLAEYNLPQGEGNYANAQVADPAAGTWTALVEAFPSGTSSTASAQFQASTATWQSFGMLSTDSLTLAPGASGTVTLTAATPSQPGDQAGSIQVTSSATSPAFATVSSIPVTLRALVPAPDPSTTFTGTLTGGNGRALATGQTSYYQAQIPSGLQALNVQVSTQNPNNTFLAELIDPTTGEAASTAFNGLQQTSSSGGSQLAPEDGAQLHVLNPAAGLWTLVVDFFNTVSGTAVSQPFTVTMNDTPVSASASSLPDSASTMLTAGTPVTADLTVTNNGTSPEAYFVDARLNSQVATPLAAQDGSALTLPNLDGDVPTYLVPSQTTALSSKVTSKDKLFFDFTYNFGDPDVISSTGKTATASLSASSIADGDWTITPFLVGPTGAKAAKPVGANTSMTATTAAFDPAVSSPTGDLWLGSVDPSNGFTPYVVNPGQSVTIPVTITPQGASGTTVTGTLYLDDSSVVPSIATFNDLFTNGPEGSDVAAFSYSYTIK
ncbi:MAG TPA: hypothetical protein VMA32_07395 [Streptosporangiaceae bacterium]|nr:hypothetical protein [Streptosporangiaceae bacterium]